MAVVLDIAATLFMYLALASNVRTAAHPEMSVETNIVETVATPKAKPAKAKKKTRAKRWSPVQTQKMLQEALQKPDGRKMRARNSNLKITRAANENVDA
jgi:hypothetical protein